MTEIEFHRASASTYIATLPQDQLDYINKIISDLTLNQNNSWEPYILDAFIDHVVVHYVSSHFFKKHKEDIEKDHRFILIDITYEKRVITASLGLFKMEEKEEATYVAGVMYK